MSLSTECQAAIFNYADADTQRNAALTGEHKEYVLMVLQLMRDQYAVQKAEGAANFVVPDEIAVYLTEECPW
jgi:hypothetical protein|tara:strand:- start:1681 stop:1896 length:216 start_codon:yes stop_codon:yes gene_type:complete